MPEGEKKDEAEALDVEVIEVTFRDGTKWKINDYDWAPGVLEKNGCDINAWVRNWIGNPDQTPPPIRMPTRDNAEAPRIQLFPFHTLDKITIKGKKQ